MYIYLYTWDFSYFIFSHISSFIYLYFLFLYVNLVGGAEPNVMVRESLIITAVHSRITLLPLLKGSMMKKL